MTHFDDFSPPSPTQLKRCEALTNHIKQVMQERHGMLSFADFMTLALYHPQLGYYNAPDFSLGEQGDFTTAPEISPLFAACFAQQAKQIFTALPQGNILELGAGTGRFAGDLLKKLCEENALPKQYFIYEISPQLRLKQQQFLQQNYTELYERIIWLDQLPNDFSGLIIANEVLDALPVHCFLLEQNTFKERAVRWHENQFEWAQKAIDEDAFNEALIKLKMSHDWPDGYKSELNLGLPGFMMALAESLTQGIILFADYGYGEREYYHPARKNGTLTCFYRHMHHDNPLIFPGLQDITAHVNFTQVVENAAENGLTLSGFTTQTAFLLSLKLLEMAQVEEKNLPKSAEFKLHQAIKTLTLPEMGERIKVMALAKNFDLPLLGFKMQDRRRDL